MQAPSANLRPPTPEPPVADPELVVREAKGSAGMAVSHMDSPLKVTRRLLAKATTFAVACAAELAKGGEPWRRAERAERPSNEVARLERP